MTELLKWPRLAAFGALALVVVAALAIASGGRAGSGPPDNSNFDFVAQPTILSAGAEGVAWGSFKAASGSGSATHVKILITLAPRFSVVPADTSTGCTDPENDGTFSCDIGTVNAGKKVKRYVAFTAPDWLPAPATNIYQFSGKVTYDNGSTGPGGGSANEITDTPDSITVVSDPDGNHDGGCTGRPNTTNVPLSSTNLVSTQIISGTALASLGLPCTWAYVGETDAPTGTSRTPVSFFNFPPTEPGKPVEVVVSIYDMPVAFKDLKVLFDPEYTGPSGTFDQTQGLGPCTGTNNTLDSTQTACLKNLEKVNKGARATILAIGTGADPGNGFG